jgi:hypothetical protein
VNAHIRKAYLLAILALCVALVAPLFGQEEDPPGRVARLSYTNGNVSFQASGEDQWNQATLNYPLTTGDRVYTDNNARAELETGNIAVRLAANTDLTTTNLNDQLVQLGLSQGTVRVRAYDIREGNSVEIDTPNAALTLLRAGSYRVETYPGDNTTLVAVNAGDLEVSGSGFSRTVHAGEAVKLYGTDQGQLEFVSAPGTDDFDQWCGDRDQRFLSSQSREYVGPYVPGYADLDQYGSWEPAPEYGQVWFPRGVVVGWVPYRYGHWAWVEPWGWTWVEDEPWGFAPFHYGRWVAIGPRWGWIPGPVVIRPVYAPALVAFVGGGGFSVGVGVQCWFPLGPRDPYFPWYHHSDVYLRQVNVTNVTVRNVTYINNYINIRNAANVHYAYQRVAPTAVSNETFRTAQPVARQVVRVNGDDIARARVIPHPEVVPDARAVAAGAPAAHPPVERFRPTVTNRMPVPRGTDAAGARGPGGNRPIDRGPNNPPSSAIPGGGNVPLERDTHTPPTPVTRGGNVPFDRGTHNPPPPANPGGGNVPFDRGTHTPPTQVNSGGSAATGGGPPHGNLAGGPPQDRRPLYTSAPPPPQNPPFSRRQPAMQEHPGRPLEPQQVNNLRQGQPPGAMHDREYAPHQQQLPAKSNPRSAEHDQKHGR